VLRKPRHVVAVDAERSEADGHIGFAAAEGGDKLRRLQKPFESWRAQPQHQLAEGHDFGHRLSAPHACPHRTTLGVGAEHEIPSILASVSALPTPTAGPGRNPVAGVVSVTAGQRDLRQQRANIPD
jgi:hypothetical protein